MYKRFLDYTKKFGTLAGYLLMKVETKTLTQDDVELAVNSGNTDSTLVRILYGNLEETPDLEFLTREGLNGIAFDMNLDVDEYLKELGVPIEAPWAEEA